MHDTRQGPACKHANMQNLLHWPLCPCCSLYFRYIASAISWNFPWAHTYVLCLQLWLQSLQRLQCSLCHLETLLERCAQPPSLPSSGALCSVLSPLSPSLPSSGPLLFRFPRMKLAEAFAFSVLDYKAPHTALVLFSNCCPIWAEQRSFNRFNYEMLKKWVPL